MEEHHHQQQPLYGSLRRPALSLTLHSPPYTARLMDHYGLRFRSDGAVDPANAVGDCEPHRYYSKPVVVLDLIWNMAFVVVSVVVLLSAFRERPSTPLRLWICGYALQCALHVGFVYLEYRTEIRDDPAVAGALSSTQTQSGVLKSLESLNTMMSSVWWVIGFYWIVLGGQALLRESPRLYWLTVVFLAFDVFFIIFCIGMACIIFFVLFCCIPIVAVAYAMATRQGASEDEIRSLSKFRYRESNPLNVPNNHKNQEGFGTSAELEKNDPNELLLHPDDSECCICLCRYVDGTELHILPCNHHFHCGCIIKWLRINATCPLCKFNIQRGDTLV
ncbi:E3 ubiquitin-protein ligase At1g12760-like [Carica papaya]|uniref:E3 ubiquitin-protein ligase At1g12760-like n=1 Tax=Carica papaya TaxID=3649 RepID=UPI000B8D15C7|nr:E3 ubiquitin-protein ligase At1g12760-like [Carica papaya]